MMINKSIRIFTFIFSIFIYTANTTKAQCTDTLPTNTIILSADTTLGVGNSNKNFLICPGIKVSYAGTQSVLNHYYLEQGAKLTVNSYHYPYVDLKTGAELNANHSTNPASIIMSLTAENGAKFTDTLNHLTPAISWCAPLVYNYMNLPNGKGCPATETRTQILQSEIRIFPNPFSSQTKIESFNNNINSVQIYDVAGKIIKTLKGMAQSVILDRSGMANGMYYIHITDNKNKKTIKSIILQ